MEPGTLNPAPLCGGRSHGLGRAGAQLSKEWAVSREAAESQKVAKALGLFAIR